MSSFHRMKWFEERRLPIIGRRVLWLLFAFLLLQPLGVSAQATHRLTISKKQITIAEVFAEIEEQTGCVIVANLERLKVSKKIQLTTQDGTLDEILSQVLSSSGWTYSLSGKFIMIVPRSDSPSKTTPAVTPVMVQPSQETSRTSLEPNFEQAVKLYRDEHPLLEGDSVRLAVRYDTVKHTIPHDGVFIYPEQTSLPEPSRRKTSSSFAQDTPPRIALKTNILYAATLTPNLSLEVGLSKKTSLDLMGSNNRWNLRGTAEDNRKMVHWVIKPEFRYWMCERLNGHFFGIHAFYARYNVSGHRIPLLFEKQYRYQGEAYGGGVSYGYHWMWSRGWGMEFTVGAGVALLDYVKKDCVKCGQEVATTRKTYMGPTALGVKLIWVIR